MCYYNGSRLGRLFRALAGWIMVSAFFLSCNMSLKKQQVITLSNNELQISVCTKSGGRLVFLGLKGASNMLKVNPDIWEGPTSIPANPTPFDEFVGYNGAIMWLSPQSEWWTQQDVNPQRKLERSVWPPDPYLIYGNNEVISLNDSSVILRSPYSPVSGITMYKTFSINKNTLFISTRITNDADYDVAWGIWSNARFDINTLFFVPDVNDSSLWFTFDSSGKQSRVAHSLENQNFSFIIPDDSLKGSSDFMTKAYMYSKTGHIVAANNGQMLVMSFNPAKPEKIHPNHGLIEIYIETSTDGENNLLELEHHSEYKKLRPGESLVYDQKWFLFPLDSNSELPHLIESYNQHRHNLNE